MSCHLAEVMTAAETDSSRTEECVELILKLWRARQFLPSGGPFKRYGRALSALEGILGSDPGFLNLSVPFRVRESSDEQDWASLAHSIRHHTHFLSLAAIALAVEKEDLRRDDLVEIAHGADPDVQTKVLCCLQTIGLGQDDKRKLISDGDYITEALDDLQASIDVYRNAYEKMKAVTEKA